MNGAQSLAFSIPEAAAAAKVSRTCLYLALQRKELSAKKHGRRTIILREELDRYLAALPDYTVAA